MFANECEATMSSQDRVDRLRAEMSEWMQRPSNHSNLTDEHPLPWGWMATYHDGAGIQFVDAIGRPVLPALIYDVELAADLLKTINSDRRQTT